MALIASTQVHVVAREGVAEKAVLYRIKNVDTGDTLDVSDEFFKFKAASFIAAGALTTIGTVTEAALVLTLTLATMADATIYLLVVGDSN